jgi:23S rRNA pseudouridine2605 synthase
VPLQKAGSTKPRLGKFLADAGIASRRHAEKLIADGEVTVNGRIITDPATAVSPDDMVTCGGEAVKSRSAGDFVYLMLHKPVGVVSTMSPGAEKGPCLADLITVPEHVHPVGRLDRDTSGLILMTNNGGLTLHLTHPSHEIEKEYHVKLHRQIQPRDWDKIGRGIVIDDRKVRVKDLGLVKGGRLSIVITEGRNRIVRRLFGSLKYNVAELKRVRIGPVSLGHLGIGRWRKLTPKEIELLTLASSVTAKSRPRIRSRKKDDQKNSNL